MKSCERELSHEKREARERNRRESLEKESDFSIAKKKHSTWTFSSSWIFSHHHALKVGKMRSVCTQHFLSFPLDKGMLRAKADDCCRMPKKKAHQCASSWKKLSFSIAWESFRVSTWWKDKHQTHCRLFHSLFLAAFHFVLTHHHQPHSVDGEEFGTNI